MGRGWRAALALAALLLGLSPAGGVAGAAAAAPGVERIAGATRFETAVEVSRRLHEDRAAPAAVLARADDFADALAGTPLAHHLGGPLLLTSPTRLHAATRTELVRAVQPGAVVHVLGGEGAVSNAVADEVAALGFVVERHAGRDRFETAARIAERLAAAAAGPDPPDAAVGEAPAGHGSAERVIIAAGDRHADALAAGPVAAAAGWPILLTTGSALPPATAQRAAEARAALIVGGRAVVSPDVEAQLRHLGLAVERVAGASRAETAIALADAHAAGPDAFVVAGDGLADALAGGVLAAATGSPIVFTASAGLLGATAEWLARRKPAGVHLLGGAAVIDAVVADAVVAAYRSDPAAPRLRGADPPAGATVQRLPAVAVTAEPRAARAGIQVHVAGRPVPGELRAVGAVWELELDPLPPLPPGRHPIRVEATVVGDTGTRRSVHGAVLEVAAPTRRSPEGWPVAPGTSPLVGSGALTRFTVEVEPATGIDVTGVAFAVEDALLDRRGWTAPGRVALQRVDDPAAARVRVVVATPATVDRFCAGIANTAGRFSCWDGRRAMLNSWRWQHGADAFGDDLVGYRRYLVNHEVGHGFGHRHVACPAPGAPAPVMMQQSKGTGACRPNGWPFP